jgi:hypothetical protein
MGKAIVLQEVSDGMYLMLDMGWTLEPGLSGQPLDPDVVARHPQRSRTPLTWS